jgi:hypothetical protein
MKIPMLVKISSVLIFLKAVVSFFASYVLLTLSGFGDPGFNDAHLVVITMSIFAIILIIVGIAICRGRNWARIIALIFAVVWCIFWLFQIRNSYEVLEICFFILGPLAFVLLSFSFFQNNCKLFFKNQDSV